ncbi:MAG: hypothetical protein K2I64_04220 [Muribaculaceae bacterium]|nr:hypothetical protein [Muribaculaceae bacterium]
MAILKRLTLTIMLLLAGGFYGYTQDGIDELSATDRELLYKAVDLVDGDMSESALEDFDMLAKKYPKNYLVQYERAYALYSLHRYDQVIKAQEFFLSHKDADELAFQLVGNAYDITGDRRKAAEIYNEGLKRYPNSGKLYLELGNIYNLDKDYDKAFENYNTGIRVDPNFASNYFQAANLYLNSEGGKVWGLIYAEAEILLAPSNEFRHQQMASMMVDCFRENIKLNYDSAKTSLSVTLTPTRTIRIDPETHIVYLNFPGVYETVLQTPLMSMLLNHEQFTASIPQLIEIRRGAIDTYYALTDNLYGKSMYMMEFQKEVIDAGHWDAYNYFIFSGCYPEEFDAWYEEHEEEFDSFVDWYNNTPFTLGNGRSVTPGQLFDNYRPLDLIEATRIASGLLEASSAGSAD